MKLERRSEISVEVVHVSGPYAIERLRQALQIILAAACRRNDKAPIGEITPDTTDQPDNKSGPALP